jgi:hypothetical protein
MRGFRKTGLAEDSWFRAQVADGATHSSFRIGPLASRRKWKRILSRRDGFFCPQNLIRPLTKEGDMSPERIVAILRENGIPQVAVCRLANVTTFALSLYLRKLAPLPERSREEIEFAVNAMLELADESPCPVDWRQVVKVQPILEEKMAAYRRTRIAELRKRFETSRNAPVLDDDAPDIAEVLGSENGCSCG